MSEEKWAIITGADGGMGTEITRAVAEAGYRDRKRKHGSHGSRSVFYGIDSFFCRSDCGASSPRFPADE